MSKIPNMRFFEADRIDNELLKTQVFIDALHLIETTVMNPNLNVKFAQTCIISLRNEQLFDLTECQKHITEIYNHLLFVLRNINIELANLTDKCSSFTLCHRTKPSFDIITVDRAVINWAANIHRNDSDTFARLTFFLYAKLLHELAHAAMAELGRRLPYVKDDDDRFSSPATHALTGEAGDAIERHFFGSVTDACGHYIDDENSIYVIEHVILRERRNKQVITSAYLRRFMELNLAQVTSMPIPDTENLSLSLSSKKRRGYSKSPTSKRSCSDRQSSTTTTPTMKRLKSSPTKGSTKIRIYQTHNWGWGPAAFEDDDDETSMFDSTGKPRHRGIMWKE